MGKSKEILPFALCLLPSQESCAYGHFIAIFSKINVNAKWIQKAV
jgi:hypothetical protein